MFRWASHLSICLWQNNVAIFSDTINMIYVKLCMMVVLSLSSVRYFFRHCWEKHRSWYFQSSYHLPLPPSIPSTAIAVFSWWYIFVWFYFLCLQVAAKHLQNRKYSVLQTCCFLDVDMNWKRRQEMRNTVCKTSLAVFYVVTLTW